MQLVKSGSVKDNAIRGWKKEWWWGERERETKRVRVMVRCLDI